MREPIEALFARVASDEGADAADGVVGGGAIGGGGGGLWTFDTAELAALRVAKVTGGAASKLSKMCAAPRSTRGGSRRLPRRRRSNGTPPAADPIPSRSLLPLAVRWCGSRLRAC